MINDMPFSTKEPLLGLFHRPDLSPRTLEEIREGMIDFLVEDNERIKKNEKHAPQPPPTCP